MSNRRCWQETNAVSYLPNRYEVEKQGANSMIVRAFFCACFVLLNDLGKHSSEEALPFCEQGKKEVLTVTEDQLIIYKHRLLREPIFFRPAARTSDGIGPALKMRL